MNIAKIKTMLQKWVSPMHQVLHNKHQQLNMSNIKATCKPNFYNNSLNFFFKSQQHFALWIFLFYVSYCITTFLNCMLPSFFEVCHDPLIEGSILCHPTSKKECHPQNLYQDWINHGIVHVYIIQICKGL